MLSTEKVYSSSLISTKIYKMITKVKDPSHHMCENSSSPAKE